MENAIMYASMDEPDFWATSTISPTEAMKVADAWIIIYTTRLKSKLKQKEISIEKENLWNKKEFAGKNLI